MNNVMKSFLKLYNDNAYLCVFDMNNTKNEFLKVSELKEKDYSNKENIFFTPNEIGFRHNEIRRKQTYLEKFSCLYCDIDLKDSLLFDEWQTEECFEYLNYHVFDGDLPMPTMVNFSGHGLHIYWKIEDISYRGNIEKWKYFQNYIYENLEKCGADKTVVNDTVRVLRMEGTINKKDDSIAIMCENAMINNNVYNLDKLLDEYTDYKIVQFEEKKKKVEEKKNKITAKSVKKYVDKVYKYGNKIPFLAKLYQSRVNDLQNLLLNYRDGNGTKRECILFLIRYYMNILTENKADSLKFVLELNNRLNHPLSEKEVIQATRSAENYAYGNGLNWSNKKIIDFLDITPDEQKGMKCIIGQEEKKERKKKSNRKYYEKCIDKTKAEKVRERQQQIFALLKCGKNCKQICEILGISRSTYYTDLKVINSDSFVCDESENTEQEYVSETLASTGTDGCPKNSDRNIIESVGYTQIDIDSYVNSVEYLVSKYSRYDSHKVYRNKGKP